MKNVAANPACALAKIVAANEPGCEARHLAAALAQDDALAKTIFDDVLENLAFALSHAVQLLHPQVIVIGGGFSLIGEPVRAALEKALPKFIMDAFLPGPKITLAALREDAVPVGALALAALQIKL